MASRHSVAARTRASPNKTNPLIETLAELYQNKDYYGGSIYDSMRDPNPGVAYADYLLNQSIPFSWRGWEKMREKGAPMLDQMLSFWGIQPAPSAPSRATANTILAKCVTCMV